MSMSKRLAALVRGLALSAFTLLTLLVPCELEARPRAYGFVSQGGLQLIGNSRRAGAVVANPSLQQSYPLATVTVYLHGTTTVATTYNEAGALRPTSPGPFTADINGYWYFYADSGRYDVRFSGGGISSPYTLSDIQLIDTAATVNLVVSLANYGALGDTQSVSDASISSSTTSLVSISGPFTVLDIGKHVWVAGAGAAGAALSTTISAYTSATTVTLASAASTSVSGKEAAWGTDDTAAIQSAVNVAKVGTGHGSVTIIAGNSAGLQTSYMVTDNIDYGDNFVGATITSYGWGSVNSALGGQPTYYHGVNFRWGGADGQGKPIFLFGNGSSYNTVSHLGFTVTDGYGIWFKPTATTGRFVGNTVDHCQFWSRPDTGASHGTGILTGFVLGDSSDADIGESYISDSSFFSPIRYGMIFNSSNNGYQAYLTRNHFALGDIDSASRGVRIGNWNNLTMDKTTATLNGTYVSGAYVVESTGTTNGWIDINGFYAEVPTILKIASLSGTSLAGTTIRNLYVNTVDTSASAAIDITGYAILDNVCVSSYKGSAQQRTVRATEGGIVRGGLCNNSGTGPAMYDTYTAGTRREWNKLGPPARDPSGSTSAMIIPNGKYLSSWDLAFDTVGAGLRRIIGYDSGGIRIGSDGSTLVLESNKINANALLTSTATLSGGTIAVSNANATASSLIQLTYKTISGTPGTLSYTTSAGVGFTINSTSGTDASTVVWEIKN